MFYTKFILFFVLLLPCADSFSYEASQSYNLNFSGSSSGEGSTYSFAYSLAFARVPSHASVYNKSVIPGVNGSNWVVTLFWRSK
tara:strand:- start:5046 stop:5297 length:252 start_codon:yes stop_codon:yes gene_type:complete